MSAGYSLHREATQVLRSIPDLLRRDSRILDRPGSLHLRVLSQVVSEPSEATEKHRRRQVEPSQALLLVEEEIQEDYHPATGLCHDQPLVRQQTNKPTEDQPATVVPQRSVEQSCSWKEALHQRTRVLRRAGPLR